MPPRLIPRRDGEPQLPFTGETVNDSDFAQDLSIAEHGGQTPPLPRSTRSHSITAQTLSGSFSRNPIRSFAHGTASSFAGE